MRIGEQLVTYIFGLIALTVVLRYGSNVDMIIGAASTGVTNFAGKLLM